MKKTIEFIDDNNKRAIVDVEITHRNGYPEFTMSGRYAGSWGQCLDEIAPRTDYQRELIELWKKYHLQNVEGVKDFHTILATLCDNIEEEQEEYNEENRPKTEEEKLAQMMEEYGIDEDNADACKAYLECTGAEDLRDFEESYSGEFSSDEEFAQDMAENIGAIDRNASWPNNCIDWEHAASELMYDYSEQDGYYFRNL